MKIPEKEKRLFIISNSTHYLNVQTYIESHSPGENYLIYLNKYSKGYQEFIKILKKDQNINLVEVISDNQKQKFPINKIQLISFFVKVLLLKSKFGRDYNAVFLSNYLSWKQHFILKQFGREKVVLINDGTAIFKTVQLRKLSKKITFPHVNSLINKYLDLNFIESLHFYSPIQLEVAEYDSLEKFNFKATNNSKVNLKKIYFVGSDLVELDLLKLKYHLNYLHQIKGLFQDCQITYFAHRGEKDILLEKYKFFGNVVRDSIPFEQRIDKEKELPGVIISYSSSVLINLPQVYPQILFYYFPLEGDSIPDSSRFKKSYPELLKYFEKINAANFTALTLTPETSLENS